MTNKANKTVGFIGLGAMGGYMAANLLRAGYPLIVHDIDEKSAEGLLSQGARWATSPRALAEASDVIFTCLPSLAAIEAVALGRDGLVEGVKAGQIFFELSTNSIELAKKLHKAFADRGAHMLEAPISGGATGARRGRLAIWAGGDRDAYDAHIDVLSAMADCPSYVGPIGAGLTTKLVNNCLSQAVQAAIAEVFMLGVKAGAEPLALWSAIRQGAPGRRRTFDGLIDQFLPGEYDTPHAALRIIDKDMHLATDLARELGVSMPISEIAYADIQAAMARGWSERDCRSVMLLPQERAGVRIAVAPEAIAQVLQRDPAAPTDGKHGMEDTDK